MRKSIKKCLMLMLLVATMMVATLVVASAETVTVMPDTIICKSDTCKGEDGKGTERVPKYGAKYEPQCNAKGYTEILCGTCGELWGKIDVKDSLKHILVSDKYVKVTGAEEYYMQILKCSRGCGYSEAENDKDHNVIKYCKVSFINDFVAVKFESQAFCPYTDLVARDSGKAAYKSVAEEVFYVEYPTGEDTVKVSSKVIPVRMADKKYANYLFMGWVEEDKAKSKNGEYLHFDVTLGSDLVGAAKSVVVVGADSPADYNYNAVFAGDTNVKHLVKFYNYDGTLLYKTEVAHGIQQVAYKGEEPGQPDNAEYVYTFKGWKYAKENLANKTVNLENIYDEVSFMADYNYKLKEYNFMYYTLNEDGEYVHINKNVKDTVTISGTGSDRKYPVYGPTIDLNVYKHFDAEYFYEPTGKWLIPARNNYVVDLKAITLPYGTLDNTQIDHIALVPQFYKVARYYKLPVTVWFKDDGFNHPTKIKIQVVDDAGKGIGYAELHSSDEKHYDAEKEEYYIEFDVSYSKSYTVTVTATGYGGEKTAGFIIEDKKVADKYYPGSIKIELTTDLGEPCNCICHTVFKPVWVGILNLLNSLFKKEFVCCGDMFANIGDQLNYGPGK